jgi:hypothetical protein
VSRRFGHSDSAIHSLRDTVVLVTPRTVTLHDTGINSSVSVDVKTNGKEDPTLVVDLLKIQGSKTISSTGSSQDHVFVMPTVGIEDGQ